MANIEYMSKLEIGNFFIKILSRKQILVLSSWVLAGSLPGETLLLSPVLPGGPYTTNLVAYEAYIYIFTSLLSYFSL